MPPGAANDPEKTGDVAAAGEETTSSAEELVDSDAELTDSAELGEKPSTTSSAEDVAATSPVESPVESPDEAPVEPVDEPADESAVDPVEESEPAAATRNIDWARVAAYGLLPGLVLVLALAAGYFKWEDSSVRDSDRARAEAMQTAKDSTIRMLSYKPETVDKDLKSARDLLTGDFRDQYTSLITDVVIPGAQQKKISAVATVPAEGAVSADPNKAVVLLFVNQTVVVGQDAPTDTASSVRVTLVKTGDRWLISQFDPV
jgi:Mce-associated membrane protein